MPWPLPNSSLENLPNVFSDAMKFALKFVESMSPESARTGARKSLEVVVFSISKISFHQANVLLAIILALTMFALLVYCSVVRYILRPALRKYVGMEFENFKISILKQSMSFSEIIILPLESPLILPIFGALFPSAVVKRCETSDDHPESTISIEKFGVKLRIGSLEGRIHRSENTTKSVASKLKNLIRRYIPRPVIVVKMSNVILTVEKAYIAPDPPLEFHATERLPSAIPPSHQRHHKLPTFDQEAVLDFLRNDEINDAEAVTFWIERWISHVVSKMKMSELDTGGNNAHAKDNPTDDEKANSFIKYFVQVFLHSISLHLQNASLVLTGADSDFVKATREKYSSREANFVLAKLPRSKRALSIVGADAIEIAFSSDADCNLFLCCAGVHIKVGSPFPTTSDQSLMAWHSIAHPFEVVAELKGMVSILIWALNYDHHFHSKSVDLHVTVSELAISLSPKHIHTLLLHLDDWIDTNAPYNEWYFFLRENHMDALGLSDREKLAYCESYPTLKTPKLKESKEVNGLLSSTEIKDLEKKMTRHEIMSLRCFAMRQLWRIPKESQEFADFMRMSKSSIVESTDPLQDIPAEILIPFQQQYPSPIHALVTLVRWKYALLSLFKIKYAARKLHLDFPSDTDELGACRETSRRRFPSSLTSSGVSFELLKSDPLFQVPDSASLDSPRRSLNVTLSIKDVGWSVVCLPNLVDELPAFLENEPVGIVYKQKVPMNAHAFTTELKTDVAPTSKEESTIYLNLISTDLVIIVNPLPLLSALQTLMEASCIPLQTICEEELDQASVNDIRASASPRTLDMSLNDSKDQLDDSVDQLESGLLQTLSTDVDIKVEHISILFLVNGTAFCHDILHFDVKDIEITLDSNGATGYLKMTTEPFEFSAGRIITTSSQHLDWELLPFKPIVTVQGVRFLTSIKHNRMIKETMYDIGMKSGVEFVEVILSPLTLTALNGAIHSLQPFFAPDMEYEDQLQAQRKAEQDNYRSNFLRQRQELQRIFNTIDADQSGTLQDNELEKLVRMMFEKSSGSTKSATGLTAAEMHREKMFLLSMFDSKGTNEVTFPDVDMILYRIANNIDDSNLTPDIGSTGIGYLDNFNKSNEFLSGIFLRNLIRFVDLREFTAMHHVFRITGYDDIDKKSNFPAPTLWHAGGIEMFWDHYVETGCTRNSLNNQDIKMVQQKLVRSLCNYEFAKYCWKVLVQPEFHRASPQNELENEVTSWLLDNTGSKCTAHDSFIDLLLKHVKIASDDKKYLSPKIHLAEVQYAVSFDIVVDSVTLSFGNAHTSSLIEIDLSHISLKSRALLSDSGWFTPGTEDRNKVSFCSMMSASYLNTKHGYMECAIQPYPCYGSAQYHVTLPDASESTDTSSFSVCLDCPRFLNVDVGPTLLETASVITNIISFSSPPNSSASLFSGCLQLRIKNCTGRDIKVSTEHFEGSVVNPDHLQSFTSIGIDSYAFFPLPSSKGKIGGLSFFTERYKMMNIQISPYQPLMFPLLRRKKQHGKIRDKQSVSGFGSFLTLVPSADSLDAITIEARSCVTIQTQIPVKIRIVRLPKSLGYLNKRGTKSLIDLNKKNLIPALKRLVRGALIVYEKDIAEGLSCAVPVDLLNSSRYFALLIQDITTNDRIDVWRDPVLLTQDFLFNTTGITDVSRSHSLSGIVVKKERLNVQVSSKRRGNNDMMKRTAWDCRIVVVPFFILLNSMPFPLSVRIWQYTQADVDTLWIDPTLTNEEEDSSGDEDQSSSMASSWIGNIMDSAQYHLPPPGSAKDIYSEVCVKRGKTILLSGINLQQRLFLQVSQNIEAIGSSCAKLMWSSPLLIRLDRLRTGASRKGTLSLPQRILDLGDGLDALVDTSIDGETGMPTCTIFCPYWIINKTGMKMEYMISGQSRNYLDSGAGGLPIMIHGGKLTGNNKIYKKSSSEIAAIPLECPKETVLKHWWDESTNGTLVLKSNVIKNREGHPLVGWSEQIEMDAAGTSGKLNCKYVVLSAKIDSLAGAFYKTNLITLSPHFIVKNMLHISVTIIPLSGSQNDVIRSANHLRLNPELFSEARIDLSPGKSTILYTFHQISSMQTDKWVAFCVQATRSRPTFKGKWHIISIETTGSTYYGEHDGLQSTMCGILEVKAHSSDGGSRVVSISHANNPPFCIENRSNTHFLQFAQDDDEATVFELPPMHSCGFTWDSPFGNKRLRATVIRRDSFHWASSDDYNLRHKIEKHEQTGSVTTASVAFDESSVRSIPKKKSITTPRQAKSQDSTRSIDATTVSTHNSPSVVRKRSKIFDASSRSYSMSKVGRKKNLPCATTKAFSSSQYLHVHLRILAGTKILSFNDSDFLAQQVEGGIMRKGGSFKSALIETAIEGIQLTVLDDSPRELLGITVRDVQFVKPKGSIEATIRIRHFQVDAMLPDARYPIIIQPLPLGIDRRKNDNRRDAFLDNLERSDCYWSKHDERPVPILEIVGSYVPQTNMTWIPNLYVMISPCKVNVDVDYIFRIVGMMITSISKYKISSSTPAYSAARQTNSPLKFTTKGQTHFCLTYLEKLYIAPVYFEVELDIKDDRSTETEEEGALTLHAIARSTNSAVASAILGWIINVGANFAHVSPTFKYSELTDADRYCDIIDLAKDIIISYVIQSIQQSYKVIFSMHLLGDPSLLAHEWKTGVTDLVSKTHDEVKAGGKEGVGRGFASFLQHVVGGTFFFVGKATGSMSKMIDSVTSNDLTSKHLKPDFASHRNRPRNAPEGIVQGTDFLARTIIYGVAGLIGNPYRGAKTGRVTGLTKGFVSGLGGAFVSPLIGALGFIAKAAEGIGAQTKCLEIGVIQTRCRPARTVPWGSPMPENVVPYMKAVGIRVHTVRYQKVRKRVGSGAEGNNGDNQNISWKNSKEFKRIKTAEERRNSPPRKVVTILYTKDNHSYSTTAMKPKLLPDGDQNDILSRYAVVFSETVVLRVSDMQLSDEVVIQFRNNTLIKSTSKPLAVCKITIGDIYSFILKFSREQMVQNEKRLTQDDVVISNDLFNSSAEDPHSSTRAENRNSLVIPAPQEFSLFRTSLFTPSTDMLDIAHKELSSIQRSEEERLQDDDSDSYVSPDTLFDNQQKARADEAEQGVRINERLYGTISLSFFPVPW